MFGGNGLVSFVDGFKLTSTQHLGIRKDKLMVKSITSSSVLLWRHRLGSGPDVPNKHSILGFPGEAGADPLYSAGMEACVVGTAWWTLSSFCRSSGLETSILSLMYRVNNPVTHVQHMLCVGDMLWLGSKQCLSSGPSLESVL